VDDSNAVDKLGYGGGNSPEGTAAPNPPPSGSSYERKAFPESTPGSLAGGGDDELSGNGQDTNNNAQDFVIRAVRQPQNSSSTVEQP
jgi:hypothetical protein